MSANGFIILATTGGIAIAIAILVALSIIFFRRRADDSRKLQSADPEVARGLREIQEDIEKGQRGY